MFRPHTAILSCYRILFSRSCCSLYYYLYISILDSLFRLIHFVADRRPCFKTIALPICSEMPIPHLCVLTFRWMVSDISTGEQSGIGIALLFCSKLGLSMHRLLVSATLSVLYLPSIPCFSLRASECKRAQMSIETQHFTATWPFTLLPFMAWPGTSLVPFHLL
jgi:hypothetical protein